MTGRQLHGHSHGHGPHHIHARALHTEIEAPHQLESRTMVNTGFVGIDAGITRVVPRANDDEKPIGNSMTVPIVLGVCIPLILALCVLFYLHRRTTAKQRREDETDKYKSMDFGLGDNMPGKTNKRRSAFFGKEKDSTGHKTQLSMDMNLSSPYLLPPNLQQSRESMNSLAKTLHQNEDPYRPIANYQGSDVGSLRSFKKGVDRNSSIYTSQTRSSGDRDSARGRPMPGDVPQRQRSIPPSPLQELPPAVQAPQRQQDTEDTPPLSAKNEFRFVDDNAGVAQVPEIQEPAAVASHVSHSAVPQESRPLSNDSFNPDQAYVGALVSDRDSLHFGQSGAQGVTDSHNSFTVPPGGINSLPPRQESMPVIDPDVIKDYQDYADGPNEQFAHDDRQAPNEHEYPNSAGLGVPAQDNRRLSVGLRPLPPDDFLESEDPEFRANRIRSFYKEYFEETKVDHGQPPPIPQQASYYEDYDSNYMGDAAFFDPDNNAFVMPYAEPVTRRAMTPPPNNRRPMPGPRQRGPHAPHGSMGGMSMGGVPYGRPRAGSTMSSNRWAPTSPRPGSSASQPRFSGKPKKPLPPPSALSTLPTPSKLRDDSFALLGALEFAPPPTFKDQAAGRSQSPVGERRPYALNTPVHSPLVSAFEETAALPSPHLLRKSGTFTSLDFAPPRRFKDPDTMSDAGSIRSNRSGISTANLSAIRGGAGRVSRLPGDQVFTQAAMNNTLKPSWNMRD